MKFTTNVSFSLIVVGMLAFSACQAVPTDDASVPVDQDLSGEGDVPIFEWDPYWPKLPLPNNWAMGNVAGIEVDEQDHVWVLTRPRTLLRGHEDDASYPLPESQCCMPPPSVIEFDQEGNVVQGWGGPGPEYDWVGSQNAQGSATSTNQGSPQAPPRGYDATYDAASPQPPSINLTPREYHWPPNEHSLAVDHNSNVWLAGSHVLKFTRGGQFLMELGYAPPGTKQRDSHNTELLGGGSNVAGVAVDPETNEVFVADGYANRRIIVFDADTGEFKRYWGAYGEPPDDTVLPRRLPFEWKPTDPPPSQFAVAHSVRVSHDGLVYVGDRNNSRIQVFEKDGTFVQEAFVRPTTMRGTLLDLNFSGDPEQRWIFVADGRNDKVWVLRRSDLRVITEFGHGGQFGGQFTIIHAVAADSQNNVYAGESLTGNRVQRFLYKGTGPATRQYDEYGMEMD